MSPSVWLEHAQHVQAQVHSDRDTRSRSSAFKSIQACIENKRTSSLTQARASECAGSGSKPSTFICLSFTASLFQQLVSQSATRSRFIYSAELLSMERMDRSTWRADMSGKRDPASEHSPSQHSECPGAATLVSMRQQQQRARQVWDQAGTGKLMPLQQQQRAPTAGGQFFAPQYSTSRVVRVVAHD